MTDKLCARKGYRHLSWFPEAPDLQEKTDHLIAICNVCPSRAECLADARGRMETAGVWGGQDFSLRTRVRRPRPTPPGEHACPMCARSFTSITGLRVHRGKEHAGLFVVAA
jgi:hypothetical protein